MKFFITSGVSRYLTQTGNVAIYLQAIILLCWYELDKRTVQTLYNVSI